MSSYRPNSNYEEQGGNKWVVGGELVVTGTQTVDKLNYNIDYEETGNETEGTVFWNGQEGTTTRILKGGVVALQDGQELFVPRCVNKTGADIPNGSVVYVSGAQGNRPTIALADADTYATSYKTIGVTTEEIADNAEGYVTISGTVRGLDTSSLDAGDCVFLSTTAGEFATTQPADGKMRIFVGMITKSHVTDGHLCVKIQRDKYMFGNVDNGNYSYFEEDGHLVAKGEAVTFRDEYVAGDYFAPQGANAPDLVNVTIGGVVTRKYAFDGVNTTEKLGNTFEIQHDIDVEQVNSEVLAIEQHIHLAPSDAGSGVVKFTLDWAYIPPFGAPEAMGSSSTTYEITGNQQYYNLLCGCELSVPTGGFVIGGLIEFTLTRDPSDAEDTYTSDVIFYKTALHVPVDMLGSRDRYTK